MHSALTASTYVTGLEFSSSSEASHDSVSSNAIYKVLINIFYIKMLNASQQKVKYPYLKETTFMARSSDFKWQVRAKTQTLDLVTWKVGQSALQCCR